ncbi:MAG: putative ORFan [Satyrvirus sp.]|uniref:Putative ORFan n=1 Tax=Satyrvirus sp. TaxID=2487771 RepID=A0A3G5AD39_9VIRU|nr:MAG: putative ORFan [Satyrvirus sp.]
MAKIKNSNTKVLMNFITEIVIILISIAVGMLIGLLARSGKEYHGPNAADEVKKNYYNKRNKKCYKFGIQPYKCPT